MRSRQSLNSLSEILFFARARRMSTVPSGLTPNIWAVADASLSSTSMLRPVFLARSIASASPRWMPET